MEERLQDVRVAHPDGVRRLAAPGVADDEGHRLRLWRCVGGAVLGLPRSSGEAFVLLGTRRCCPAASRGCPVALAGPPDGVCCVATPRSATLAIASHSASTRWRYGGASGFLAGTRPAQREPPPGGARDGTRRRPTGTRCSPHLNSARRSSSALDAKRRRRGRADASRTSGSTVPQRRASREPSWAAPTHGWCSSP